MMHSANQSARREPIQHRRKTPRREVSVPKRSPKGSTENEETVDQRGRKVAAKRARDATRKDNSPPTTPKSNITRTGTKISEQGSQQSRQHAAPRRGEVMKTSKWDPEDSKSAAAPARPLIQ